MEGIPRKILWMVIVMLLYPARQYSQDKSGIVLPKANTVANTKWFAKENQKDIVLYLTENHELFINNTRMHFWNAIVPYIMDRDMHNGALSMFSSRMVFYMDHRAQYAVVDRIKEELSRTPKKFFVYELKGDREPVYIGSKVYGTIKDSWSPERIQERNQKKIRFF
ncbi:hypothetical protein [Spongiimicrobium salis]|uniref:hypothetical protein n=1 Tax=Spongiimicrobium salis TaxID=1667022 RepID=UPI00374DD2EA